MAFYHKRAEVVMAEMISLGIHAYRMRVRGHGQAKPRYPNARPPVYGTAVWNRGSCGIEGSRAKQGFTIFVRKP